MRTSVVMGWVAMWALADLACKDKALDATDAPGLAEPCKSPSDTDPCEAGLVCEPVGTTAEFVCAVPVEIRGQVVDAVSLMGLPDAVVTALDETGATISDAVRTDADGHYTLAVSARRNAEAEAIQGAKWTLFAAAVDHQSYPGGVRAPIPVDASSATPQTTDDDHEVTVIENSSTVVALLPLSGAGGVTVEGTIEAEIPGGTLVVAEGAPAPAPYTIAGTSGDYVLFNVPASATHIRGYRRGLELTPVVLGEGADLAHADLVAAREDVEMLARVSGSVKIVNAPGGAATSVVLVPASVYDDVLERGPVPMGLRAPEPPMAPSVTSEFTIAGVPPGTYQVLAAFEDDDLVRDPDASIAGTTLQEVTVGSDGTASISESFKITEALAVVSPGAEGPEVINTATPDFRWADDSSEDRYELRVYDSFGDLIWEDLQVPGVSGADEARVTYAGPPLQVGFYYQFRATSMRETPNQATAISRTEDLRGVFVVGASSP